MTEAGNDVAASEAEILQEGIQDIRPELTESALQIMPNEVAGFLPEDKSKLTWVVERLTVGFVLGGVVAMGYSAADAADRTKGAESFAGLKTTYSATHGESAVVLLGHKAYSDESSSISLLPFITFKAGLQINANTLPSNFTQLFSQTPNPQEVKDGYKTALTVKYSEELKHELELLCLLVGALGAAANLAGGTASRWVRYKNGKIEHLEAALADRDELIVDLLNKKKYDIPLSEQGLRLPKTIRNPRFNNRADTPNT